MTKKNSGIVSAFEQRAIGPTKTSFRSLLQLRTPSGPQYVESELESELIEQLNFSRYVRDIITQPVIRYTRDGKERRYTPDVLVRLFPCKGYPPYYLIEVKRTADLQRNRSALEEKFRIASEWCGQNYAQFRVLTEKEIRTPHLANTRLLARYAGDWPEDDEFGPVDRLLEKAPAMVSSAIADLKKIGLTEAEARLIVERGVASRFVACDLSQPFDDKAIISKATFEFSLSGDSSPILKAIRTAKNF
jgi:hypothetical protein